MITESYTASVLVVSATDKVTEFLNKILPTNQFSPIVSVHDSGEAKRLLINQPFDIVIINTPLRNDLGSELAIDVASNYNTGVLLMVKSEMYEQVAYQVENYGILALARPCSSHAVFQSLKLLVATKIKLRAMEQKTASLEEKMKEIRLVNKAKSILIDKLGMSEADAHRYIEKAAMDNCVKKIDIANGVLDKYKEVEV